MTDFHLEPITNSETSKRNKRNSSIATMQTVATGAVAEQEDLVMGAGFYYKGNMIMYATRPALQLDGYIKLDIRNIPNYNTWLKYSQSGDETEVNIDFENATTETGKKATAGLHFGSADNSLYATFISDKKQDEDDDFFTPAGTLTYSKDINEYVIQDKEKAAGNKLEGKVFAYNDERKSLRFEGEISIFKGTKDFSVSAAANGTGSLETNEFKMNSLLMVDSNLPPAAFDLMALNLQDVIKNEGAQEGLGDQTELLYKVADLVGERFAKDYELKSQQGYVSLATIPEFAKSVVFADVNLKWHPKLKAFYSEGLLGVSNVTKHDINGGFEGFMEAKKTEDGSPVFNVFIKASQDVWYFFGFEDNRLMVHSSDDAFNDVIAKKTNAGKAKVGEIAFIPGSDDETLAFINRYRKQYYGIDVPYDLSESVAPVQDKVEIPGKPQEKLDKKKDTPKDAPVEEKKDTEEEKKKDEDDGF
jgi:hypothetical protein